MSILEHLKSRHLNLDLHCPIIDEENGIATFLLWNLSGGLVGYQQYRPTGYKKEPNNPKLGKYYTYRNKQYPTIAIWGVETLHLTPTVVFVTEGIFDAARLTAYGVSALAVLSNDPSLDLHNWLQMLNRLIIVVVDNDKAGNKLSKFGDITVVPIAHDLGDSSDEFVRSLIEKYVK